MILPLKILGVLKGEKKLPVYFYPLYLPACLYSIIVRIRASLYRRGIFKTRRLPCRVISVGNLAAGGTGKTPFTIYLCGRLNEKSFKPAVVTRGYKGASEGSTAYRMAELFLYPFDAGTNGIASNSGRTGGQDQTLRADALLRGSGRTSLTTDTSTWPLSGFEHSPYGCRSSVRDRYTLPRLS
jgi:hypothetical protein